LWGFEAVCQGEGRFCAGGIDPPLHQWWDVKGVNVSYTLHNPHHRFFHVNYGNSMATVDAVFDSWHDGG
jgi:hypothetical protein